jgi:hypothetical protein
MLYYIVSSSQKYLDVVLPKLLSSLRRTQNRIIIAINECGKGETLTQGNITFHYSHNSSYDYIVPIVALSLLENDDHFFWLHDTCEVGPKFDEIANNFSYQKYEFVDVFNGYCNFGIYSIPFVRKDQEWIFAQRNITKHQAIENETRWINLYPTWAPNSKTGRFPDRDGLPTYKQLEYRDVYGTGQQRMVEYYSNVDLYKFKANVGFSPNRNLNDWIVRP